MKVENYPFFKSAWITKSLLIFLISYIIRVVYLYSRGGFKYSGDTEWHVRSCSYLFNHLVGVESVAGEGIVAGINYYGYILPMCAIRYMFGMEYWGWILIIISSLTPVVLYLSVREMFNELIGIISALFLSTSWSVFRWSQELMTEPVFLFAISLAFWRITEYRRHKNNKNKILMYSVLGWGCTVRPFGVAFLIIGLGFYFSHHLSRHNFNIASSSSHYLPVILSSVVVFLSAILSRSTSRLLLDGYIFPTGEAPPGVLIPGKLNVGLLSEYLPRLMNQLFLIFATIIVRLFSTFYPSRYFWDLERTFVVVHTIIYFPMIILFFVGILKMKRSRERVNFEIIMAPIIAVLIIVSATWMEGRFRWRASMMPSIVIFSAYAIHQLCQSARIIPESWDD